MKWYVIVQFLLIALKLFHILDWSWWFIFAPTWLPFAGVAVLATFWVVIFMISIINEILDPSER